MRLGEYCLKGTKESIVGAVLVIVAASFWGLSGLFLTIILENSTATAISLAFWRDTAGFLTLFLFTALTCPRNLKIKRKDLLWLVGMGFFLGGFHIFYNQSVVINGVGVTTIFQAAMPGVVTMAAFYLWKEELTRAKIGSMVIIFLGTAMASGINIFSLEQTNMGGLIVGISVPFLYAAWSLCGKSMVSKYGAAASLTIAFGVASIMLLPFQPYTNQPFPLNPIIVFAFLGLITISTFGGFILYFMGMRYIQAGIASILVMSEILFALVYARVFLGERLLPVQVLGTLFVIMGVVFLSYRQNKQQK
jgi:drug/metabolite transporter (DMT)-like permease